MIEPEICPKCGTPRLSEAGYCVTCGTKLPKDVPSEAREPSLTADETEPSPGLGSDGAPVVPPKRRRGLITVAAGVVVALVVGAIVLFSGGEGGSSAYALQFSKASPGDTFRYHMTMDMDMTMSSTQLGLNLPVQAVTSADTLFRVVKKDGGEATVEMVLSNGTVEAEGTSQALPETRITMRIAPDGRILEINGTSLSGNTSLGSTSNLGQFTPLMPPTTVKPGDTWTKTTEVPFPFGDPISVDTQNRLAGYETIQGVRAAVIESTANTSFDSDLDFTALSALLGAGGSLPPTLRAHMSGPVRSIGSSWVDLATGRWYKTVSTATMDMDMVMSGLPVDAGVSEATLHMAGTMKLSMESIA